MMLRTIAGQLAPPGGPRAVDGPPPPVASSFASSFGGLVVGALTGVAAGWALAQQRQREQGSISEAILGAVAPPAATPDSISEGATAAAAAPGDPDAVATVDDLRGLLPIRGSNGAGIEDAPKVLTQLDAQMTTFIEQSPFLQLGTADGDGMPYVSPKGDHNGFVMVLNSKTLIIPDRPGNNILMGLQVKGLNASHSLWREILPTIYTSRSYTYTVYLNILHIGSYRYCYILLTIPAAAEHPRQPALWHLL
jgi:hypothetical protein